MNDTSERGVALLERFAEFYEQVAQIKQSFDPKSRTKEPAAGKESQTHTLQDQAALISQRLQSLLEKQRRQIDASGTPAESSRYAIAQYAVAALADEVFIIEMDWPGRDHWHLCLLEQALFGSTTAGRDFFRQLDELLGKRAVGQLDQDLAAVFLMCLRLGFRGRWRGTSGEKQLQEYNKKLLRFIGSIAQGDEKSFQQAYQYNIALDTGERMAPLSRWYRLGAIGVVLYLLISTAVWFTLTNRFTRVFGG